MRCLGRGRKEEEKKKKRKEKKTHSHFSGDQALPKPRRYYTCIRRLSNSNAGYRPMQIAACSRALYVLMGQWHRTANVQWTLSERCTFAMAASLRSSPRRIALSSVHMSPRNCLRRRKHRWHSAVIWRHGRWKCSVISQRGHFEIFRHDQKLIIIFRLCLLNALSRSWISHVVYHNFPS